MSVIQWSDALSVNVAEIDQQHKTLIQIINDLNEAMRQGKGKDTLGKTIEGLLNYARTHFATEERYFDRFGYPKAKDHKIEHAVFVEKASEFKQGFDKGQISLSIQVMNFLSNWLRQHILGNDKKYSAFFNEKGLH